MQTIRVFVIYDQPVAQAGLRSLLGRIPVVEIVGEAGLGAGVLGVIETTRPDVVVLSLDEARVKGLQTSVQVSRKYPKVRILAVSMYASEEHIMQTLASGVSGYLLKKAAADSLERAVQTVARGDLFLCPAIPSRTRQACLQRLRGGKPPPAGLTERQLQVLRLIAQSKTTKEIASLLGLSAKTVEFHRAQLMERLKIRDVPGLVRYAVRTSLIALDGNGSHCA